MSRNYAMTAVSRTQAGKGAARSLRREGKIPAVIYGDKKEPVKITLDENAINVEYYRGHMFTSLCDMDVEGAKHLVLARDVQLHPVTDFVEHVDFLRVTEKTKIAVNVPVTVINEDKAPGLTEENGILNVSRFEVEVTCRATNIPDEIEVDIEGKVIGDAIKASDAILPEGSKFVIDDRDFTIGTISAPKVIVEDEEETEGEEGEEGVEGEAAEGADGEGGDAPAEGEEKKEE